MITAKTDAPENSNGKTTAVKAIQTNFLGVVELDSAEPGLENLSRKVLLLDLPKEELKNTQVLKYIKYGEREKSTERSTSKVEPAQTNFGMTSKPTGEAVVSGAKRINIAASLGRTRIIRGQIAECMTFSNKPIMTEG